MSNVRIDFTEEQYAALCDVVDNYPESDPSICILKNIVDKKRDLELQHIAYTNYMTATDPKTKAMYKELYDELRKASY